MRAFGHASRSVDILRRSLNTIWYYEFTLWYQDNCEPLAELNKTVTPVTSAVQWTLKNLDSGLRRNDVEGLLQEALVTSTLQLSGILTHNQGWQAGESFLT
jgi:hypothetical protein